MLSLPEIQAAQVATPRTPPRHPYFQAIARSCVLALSLLFEQQSSHAEPPQLVVNAVKEDDQSAGEKLLASIQSELKVSKMPTEKEMREGEIPPSQMQWVRDRKTMLSKLLPNLDSDNCEDREAASEAIQLILEECQKCENPIDPTILEMFPSSNDQRTKAGLSYEQYFRLQREIIRHQTESKKDISRIHPGIYSIEEILACIKEKTGVDVQWHSGKIPEEPYIIPPRQNGCVPLIIRLMEDHKRTLFIQQNQSPALVRKEDLPHSWNERYPDSPESILFFTNVPDEPKELISIDFRPNKR